MKLTAKIAINFLTLFGKGLSLLLKTGHKRVLKKHLFGQNNFQIMDPVLLTEIIKKIFQINSCRNLILVKLKQLRKQD